MTGQDVVAIERQYDDDRGHKQVWLNAWSWCQILHRVHESCKANQPLLTNDGNRIDLFNIPIEYWKINLLENMNLYPCQKFRVTVYCIITPI